MKILMMAIALLMTITSSAMAAEDEKIPFAIEGIPQGEYKIMTDEEMDNIKAPMFPLAGYKSPKQQRKELLLKTARPRR